MKTLGLGMGSAMVNSVQLHCRSLCALGGLVGPTVQTYAYDGYRQLIVGGAELWLRKTIPTKITVLHCECMPLGIVAR